MAKNKNVIDKDLGWKKISVLFKKNDRGIFSKVGLQGQKGQDKKEPESPTNADLGAIHEYGTQSKKIQERSFLRSTFDDNTPKYKQEIERLCGHALDLAKVGDTTVLEGGLRVLGEAGYRADVIKRVKAYIPPHLAPATLALAEAKGRKRDPNLTLWDTGILINSIDVEVTNQMPEGAVGR